MTEWLVDPEGHEYRYVGSWEVGNRYTEYRPVQPLRLSVPFKKFVVRFRDEVWYVSAPSAEDAKRIFASEFLLTSPRPKEVTIEEVVCK